MPANRMNYTFTANKGPIVRVLIAGAPLEPERVKRLIPDLRGRHGGR